MIEPVFVLAGKARVVFEEIRLASVYRGEKTLKDLMGREQIPDITTGSTASPDEVKHTEGWLTKEAAEEFKGLVADPDRPGNWIKREERNDDEKD